jgi:MoaA/NifB/PqqE/SkfB family radical SAM enzyme
MRAFSSWPLQLREVQALLFQKKKEGFCHVTFTGGEPTLYPRFNIILAIAKRLGYKTRVISNGSGFSQYSQMASISPFLDELCFSLHGENAEIHDKITNSPGSFERITKALRLIEDNKRIKVSVNMVATALNIDFLVATVGLVRRRKRIHEIWLSNLVPIGQGLLKYDELSVKNTVIMKRVPSIVEAAAPIPIRFYGFPLCVLDELRNSAVIRQHPAVSVFRARGRDGKPFIRSQDSRFSDPPRVLTQKCEGCLDQKICGGPWERYVKKYGDGELCPRLQ